MECVKCGTKTVNPKFCSRSCAAQVTGIGRRQHGNPPALCKQCGNKGWSYKSIYCSRACERIFETKEQDKFFLSGTFSGSSGTLRKILLRLRGHRCEQCDLEIWLEQKIPLDVDHIDGNSENNASTNVRLLCKNCHALTPTFGSKNLGNGRSKRRAYRKLHPEHSV